VFLWRVIRGWRRSVIRLVREENPGLPPELRLGGRDRREGFRHVRRMGRLVLHQWGSGFLGGCQHVHDRVVFAGAHVQDGRTGTSPPQRQFDRPAHVGNMGEVAALAAVAVDDDRLARLDPAAERFQGQIGALSRPPDREEPQGEEAQAVQAGVARVSYYEAAALDFAGIRIKRHYKVGGGFNFIFEFIS